MLAPYHTTNIQNRTICSKKVNSDPHGPVQPGSVSQTCAVDPPQSSAIRGGQCRAGSAQLLHPAVYHLSRERAEPRRQDVHSQDAQDAESVCTMDMVTSCVYRIHQIMQSSVPTSPFRDHSSYRIVVYSASYLQQPCRRVPTSVVLHSAVPTSACTYHIL